ncbi:hypothetical protein O0I10_004655 [Lichtheimia ornata]|uniref:cAMP-dependent protein kinase regulatory subunit n=1 Tax=Lichtheimia ornata TaxID=688661 RepID=A0AAD7Y089_9FUNG|nr:uncharacterized protein O0I10_004655 [Lichtheimia ornata]KAJ8659676.1 hypothetical protein O0I10_004655 [Lichtheimia ornata]
MFQEVHPLVNEPPSIVVDNQTYNDDSFSMTMAAIAEQQQQKGDSFSSQILSLQHFPMPNYCRERRQSVSAESFDPDNTSTLHFTQYPKTSHQRARIDTAIANNFLFRNLDQDLRQHVVDTMAEKHIPNGTIVVQQGSIGDFYYIIEEGTFECYIEDQPDKVNAPDDKATTKVHRRHVASYGSGGSFGELALMYNAPRAATVVATSDAVVWVLDRITFRSLLQESMAHKRHMYDGFLAQIPIFQSLSLYGRHKIADALESVHFDDKDVVVHEGDSGHNFYLIEDGVALCYKKSFDGSLIQVNKLGKGDYFGELAMLYENPRAATVVADGILKCVTLNKGAFNRLLGPVIDVLQCNSKSYQDLNDAQ